MKRYSLILLSNLLILAATAYAGVNVSAPGSGSTVASPVHYSASASTACSKGVASMGVYVDNQLVYVVNGKASIPTLRSARVVTIR
jgi:hypothetical protein